jgi:predicted nuclease of predicted toxin-antitoxin system
MEFKLDENLHPDGAQFLSDHGHDACTVKSEGLKGQGDDEIAAVCRAEGRVLITIDLDFADVRHYPPHEFAGIIVLRIHNESRSRVITVLNRLLDLFSREPLVGCLWIFDDYRVRIHGKTS